MIIFAPEYDDETRACALIAESVAHSGGANTLLRGVQARRGEVLRELREETARACLIFSHGSPDEICGQDGEAALIPGDFHSLYRFPVFAYACYSAWFGQKAHMQNRIWWGYDQRMVSPPLDLVKKADVEGIFRYIAHRFHDCSSEENVKEVIDELRDQCQIYVAKYRRDNKASVASMVFFMQLWSRLRVWTPWAQPPIAHAHSWPGDLDAAI